MIISSRLVSGSTSEWLNENIWSFFSSLLTNNLFFSVHLCLYIFSSLETVEDIFEKKKPCINDSFLFIGSFIFCKSDDEIIFGAAPAANVYVWVRSASIFCYLIIFCGWCTVGGYHCAPPPPVPLATLGECGCIIQVKCHHDKSNLSGEPLVAPYLCTCINNQIYQRGVFSCISVWGVIAVSGFGHKSWHLNHRSSINHT